VENVRKLIIILMVFLTACLPTKNVFGEQEVKLIEHHDMHFVKVVINGKPTKLLIDTGASKSILDISQSEEFEFSHALLSKNQYVGLGGLQDIYVVYDYKIDGIFVSFLGADLSEIRGYFEQDGMSIVGILGSDFLEIHNCKIDFNKNIMYYNGN
jgi:hypothetical protein